MKLWRPTRCATCARPPENTIEIQRLRASLIRNGDSRMADAARDANCSTTRVFDNIDDAYTFGACGAVALLACEVTRPARVLVHDMSEHGMPVLVMFDDTDLEGEAQAEMACVLSAVLASGRVAACDMCAAPAKAVDHVRFVLRRHAIGVRDAEYLLRLSPGWRLLGTGLLGQDPQPVEG